MVKQVRINPSELGEYMNQKPITISCWKLEYPIQLELFNDISRVSRDKSFYNRYLGRFYEILSSGIFGGNWKGTTNCSEDEWSFFPDVVSDDKIIDSKATRWNGKLELIDFQIDRNLVQQCSSVFMSPRKIYFPVFKYKIANPWKFFDSFNEGNKLENLVKILSEETGFMLFLPFSVIFNIHNYTGESAYKKRYDGTRHDRNTALLSPGIKSLLINPEKTFGELGMKIEDYKITRTCLPSGMKMNQFPITPFPILIVEDVDYDSWLAKIKESQKDRVEFLLRDKATRDEYRMREDGCSDTDLDEPEPREERVLLEDEAPF